MIRLEQLGSLGTMVLLGATYGIVFIATCVSVNDHMWKTAVVPMDGQWAPVLNETDSSQIGAKFITNFTFTSPLEMMFSVCPNVVVERSLVKSKDKLRLGSIAHSHPILKPYTSSFYYNTSIWAWNNNTRYGVNRRESSWSLTCSGSFPHSDETQVCRAGCFVIPQNYISGYEKLPLPMLNFSLELVLLDLYLPGNSTEKLVLPPTSQWGESVDTELSSRIELRHNTVKGMYSEIAVHAILSLTTLLVLGYFVFALQVSRFQGVSIAEQNWVILLLISLFCMQGLSYIPYLVTHSSIFRTISNLGISFGESVLMIIGLLVIDSISETSKSISIESITSRGASYGAVRSFPWKFYHWKVLLCVFMMVTLSISSMVNFPGIDRVPHKIHKIIFGAFHWNQRQVKWALVTLGDVASYSIWVVWLFKSSYRASKSLAILPYMPTRFRQLSFRYCCLVIALVTGYFAFALLLKVEGLLMQKAFLVKGAYRSNLPLGTLILCSGMVYLLAFVYSPATYRRSRHHFIASPRSGSEFSFQIAQLLIGFSINSYYDDPLSYPKPGMVNLTSKGYTFTNSIDCKATNTVCFIARNLSTVIVTFRGTEKTSLTNFKTNLWISRSAVLLGQEKSAGSILESGGVHAGFLNAYSSVRPNIMAILAELQGSCNEFYFTGHSMGGVLAILCAYEMKLQYPAIRTRVYSFGSPKCGDIVFARKYDEMLPQTYRIVCNRDIVTSLPRFGWLYTHVGKEVFIDVHGNHLFSPSFVETAIRPSRSSFEDHKKETYKQALDKICDIDFDDFL